MLLKSIKIRAKEKRRKPPEKLKTAEKPGFSQSRDVTTTKTKNLSMPQMQSKL